MPNLEHSEFFKGTKHVYASETFEGLVAAVTKGRAYQGRQANYNNVFNELTIERTMREKREAASSKPKTHAASSRATSKPVSTTKVRTISKEECPKITAQSAFHAARSLLNDALGKVESGQEVNRRLKICQACPKIGTLKGCVPCGAMARLKEWLNEARKKLWGKGYSVPTEASTLTCGACCCSIPALLPAPLSDFRHEDPAITAKRPDACWLKDRKI